jgi:cell division protein ZapA (FtsZ GTPase activity inhibitor)
MREIIISEKQLESLTKTIKTIKESPEKSSYMAKQQLFIIATLAYKMWEMMDENEQLEDWMESKIAQTEQNVTSVVKSYMYDEFSDGNENGMGSGMDKLNFDELIIGK